jgi:hypothetical protein
MKETRGHRQTALIMAIVIMGTCAHAADLAETLDPSVYLIEDGVKEMYRGRQQQAVTQFRKALLVNPESLAAHYYLEQLGAKPARSSQQKVVAQTKQSELSEETSQSVQLLSSDVRSYPWLSREDYTDYDIYSRDLDHLPGPEHPAVGVFGHNQQLLSVYQDYLEIRETQLDDVEDQLLMREIDLVRAGDILRDRVAEMESMTHDQRWVTRIDDQVFIADQHHAAIQTMKHRLINSEQRVMDLEQKLHASELRIKTLLLEQQQFIKDLKYSLPPQPRYPF